MSKRLASFGGPSAPTSSPVSGQTTSSTPSKKGGKNKSKARDVTPSSPRPGPTSPRPKADASRVASYAPRTAINPTRKDSSSSGAPVQYLIRSTLKRAASELDEWESIASRRALKCAKLIVDTTTELENALGKTSSSGIQPASRILGSRLKELNRARVELQGYQVDLTVTFALLATRVSKLESALVQFIQTAGIETSPLYPIWDGRTWSFEHFVSHIARVLKPLNRSNHIIATVIRQIAAYSLSTGGLDWDTNVTGAHTKAVSTPNSSANQPNSNYLEPSTPRGTPPTFDDARNALVAWSAEVSRTGEFIREWVETCEIEIVGWDEGLDEESWEDGD